MGLCVDEQPLQPFAANGYSEPMLPQLYVAANVGLWCAGSSHYLFHVAHVGATTSP